MREVTKFACELLPEIAADTFDALYIVPTRLISTVAVDGFIGLPFSSFGFQNDPISFTPALATWGAISQEDLKRNGDWRLTTMSTD